MPVTTRAASTEKRRRKILDAALHCFLERGFAAATAEEIRERSGASIGSIYHHFGGKEGLAGTLHVEGLRDYQAGFLRELQRHRDARSGVQAVVRYHLHASAAGAARGFVEAKTVAPAPCGNGKIKKVRRNWKGGYRG